MKVSSKSITDFLDGKNRSFLIPVYQRNYDWNNKEQCQILWDDLCYIVTHSKKPHFFGSIVSVIDENSGDYIIIDGQQRITTISLLMLAIAHRLQEFNSVVDKTDNAVISQKLPDVEEVLSLCIDYKKQNKLKLKLLRGDMDAYQCLVDKTKCPQLDKTHIIQNYKFFYNLLNLDNIYEIYEATQQLVVVDIMLGKDDDNPQQVFESLNSKGLGLSTADKIRNFILIDLPYDKQEELYSKYWEPMEKNAGTSPDDTTNFIWTFLSYKTNKKVLSNDIYNQFKFYKTNDMTEEEILEDLFNMSEIYYKIQTQSYESAAINDRLASLLNNITKVTVPLFLDVFDKYEKNLLSEKDVVEIIDVIEAYFVRRTVCSLKPAGTARFFLMNKKINSLLDKYINASYADVFKYLVYTEQGGCRFPNNDEVLTALTKSDVYSNDKKGCKFILSKLEKAHNPKEYVQTSDLTVEHIMPQTLNNDWRIALGDNADTIHTTYLHTLGNLTLTGYNSEYSNRAFLYKKTISKGFDESPLYLNSFMKNTDTWSEKEIVERGNTLAALFITTWPIRKPQQTYTFSKDVETISLDNTEIEEQIVGKKPRLFYLSNLDKEIEVVSWKDLYAQIVNVLYNEPNYQKEMQRAFAFGNNGKFSGVISKIEESKGQKGETLWEQLIPGESVYFLTCKSSKSFLDAIRTWFEYLKISESDLEITLR